MAGLGATLRRAPATVVGWFFELDADPGAESPLTAPAQSRVYALFLWVAGVFLLLGTWLPASSEETNLTGCRIVAGVAVVSGVACLFVPWHRLPSWASLVVRVPLAAGLIALANYYSGLSPYRYSLYFCYLATVIGLCHPRWSTVRSLPVIMAAYLAPLIAAGTPGWSYWILVQVLPVVTMIGEGIAYFGSLASRALEAETRASTDPLTGLANRAGFQAMLDSACRPSSRDHTAAVVFIDLDHFKPINDRHGHQVGDEVLRTVADRLHGSVRPADRVARLGGDEFAVLLDDVAGRAGAELAVRRMVEAIGQPVVVDGDRPVTVGASAGVTVFVPGAMAAEDVLRCSDDAMYEAKQAGGDRFRFSVDGRNAVLSLV